MDMTWVTDRIAVGGGIWNELKMIEVAKTGVTHVINMQIEFDDRHLGIPHGINILWNPTDDDFQFKPRNCCSAEWTSLSKRLTIPIPRFLFTARPAFTELP